ncbi:MEDS domain-containing protein [Micromonospora echinofusca]|uniref:MEDS domain-containing protein n=1 Tax=Micromonospora echinofusca TaxID=47858 RepID=UPI0027DAFA0B|nr:MEDS domain-containing protein [Micromonospora echinofusca]
MTIEARLPTPYGHICWGYDDPAAFDVRARSYLAEGLAVGEQVWFVAAGRPETLLERLRAVPGFPEALRRGAARIVPLTDAYRHDRIVDPATQVRAYAQATEAALAAGHTGLRVVAEATPLVRTPAQLDAFVRYEHLVDRYMRTRPMSALCAYHRPTLGDRTLAELACVHPQTNSEDVLFRLYACPPADGCAAVAGELDPSNHDLFATTLDRADLRPVDGRLVVQADNLRFIDHRSLLHLHEYARRRDATAVLRTSRSAPARLVELLQLSAVHVETSR